MRGLRTPNIYAVSLLAILAAGVELRAYHLGQQSLWVDELGEGTTAQAPLSQFFYDIRQDAGAAGTKVIVRYTLGRALAAATVRGFA